MDHDELAQLLSEASSLDASIPIPDVPASVPDSPLNHYDTLNERSELSQRALQSQQQRLLSTLDDDSLVGLVNGYQRPKPRSPRFKVNVQSSIVTSDPDSHSLPTTPSSSSSQSQDSIPAPPVPEPNFGDYGRYFADKTAHQRTRDEFMKTLYQDALNDGKQYPPIFQNCIIYINGRTFPDRLQLHQKVILYGGSFMHYLSGKTKVTHIVASNLTAKKRLEFQKYKVVTPAWIVDSITAEKRLPWQDYELITGDYGQQKLNVVSRPSEPPLPVQAPVPTTLDCKDPDFVQSFFAKSRLHHLSTWKADLRALFCKKYVQEALLEPPPPGARLAIFHVDFDCFFATVSALADPSVDLSKDPIAVAHGTNSSEIASCNYVARSFGVKNGMWVRSARRLCPNLICLPYNFEQYEINSKLLYHILATSHFFQMILPISIDEAICVKYLDASMVEDSVIRQECEQIAYQIRQDVSTATNGCTVSIGCGRSLVLARLALKKAKPDGQWIVMESQQDAIDEFVSEFPLQDLPGVGISIVEKIQQHILPNLKTSPTIGDVKRGSTLQLLSAKLGTKTGQKLHSYLSGKDDEENAKIMTNPVEFFTRKSLSVDINYAIRFDTIYEIDDFIDRICEHLTIKLRELGMVTPQVTLKVMRRCEHAPIEPAKYLGSGECDTFSRSSRFGVPTGEMGLIATEIKSSFRMLACPPKDLRGIAVQLNKLEPLPNQNLQQKLPFKGQDAGNKFNVKPDAYHSLPVALKEGVRNEFMKRKIEVPPSPNSKRSNTTSPVKEYWDKFNRKAGICKREMPSSLDEDFMSHLPSQIQREIKWDHAIVKKATSSVRKGFDKRQKMMSKPQLRNRSTLVETVRFQTLERPREIGRLLRNWIDETIVAGPHVADLNLFDGYLSKLAAQGKTHHILAIAKGMSSHLEYHSSFDNESSRGRQEWEEYLLRRMIPILHASAAENSNGVQLVFDI